MNSRTDAAVGESLAPHLKAVPGVGTFSAGRLASGYLEHLGGQADWALHLQVLVLCALQEDLTHCSTDPSSFRV